MTIDRKAAIEESDRRWPDYGDPKSHALSGGFIDGALWAVQFPAGDLSERLEEVFPVLSDPIEEIVNGRWRRGYELGALWARTNPLNTLAAEAPAPSESLPTDGTHDFAVAFKTDDPGTHFVGEVVRSELTLEEAKEYIADWSRDVPQRPFELLIVSRPKPVPVAPEPWLPVVPIEPTEEQAQ